MSRYKIDPYLFSDNEKIVLKALSKNNTPLKVSRETNIPRPTVYFILERLKTRGLVKCEKLGKKVFWTLKNNAQFESHLDTAIDHKNIKIYDSAEMIVNFLYNFIAQDTTRFQFLNGDHNPKHWSNHIQTNDVVKLNNLIRDNNLVSDVISSTSFIKENENVLGKEWKDSFIDKPTEYHVLDSKYTNFNSQILLRKGKVFIMNIEKPVVYEISDPDIYKCFASIFEFIKDKTPKRNLSEVE